MTEIQVDTDVRIGRDLALLSIKIKQDTYNFLYVFCYYLIEWYYQ